MQEKEFSIGIDIGGTNTDFGLVNRRGEISFQATLKTRDYKLPGDFVIALKNQLGPVIQKIGETKITGIGIGAPNGNVYSGNIELAANLPWKGTIPLRQMIKDTFGLPAFLTNDANATAIGEMTYGAAKGMQDFLLITLGTGVGSGFVANGKLIYGHDGFAGELGHVTAIRDGRPCGCGRRGCLETYASATGIVTTAIEFLRQEDIKFEDNMQADWLLPVWKKKNCVSAKEIYLAAKAGDPMAVEIFNFTGKILGQTLADAVAITSPKAIIFFGGLAKAGAYILTPTKKAMEENLLAIFKNKIEVIPSGLVERDAAILGAAALAWQ
jgi:glucokinase